MRAERGLLPGAGQWVARHAEVDRSVRIVVPVQVAFSDVVLFGEIARVEVITVSSKNLLDSALAGVRIDLAHHAGVAGRAFRVPAKAIKEDHVDLELQREFELALDARHIPGAAIAPVIGPAVDL